VDTSDVIAIVAALVALGALVPALLSWREARNQTQLARGAAKAAEKDADIATKSAQAAEQQAFEMRKQVEVAQQQAAAAQEQAQAANRAAGAAEGAKAAAAGGLLFEIDRALAAFDDVHTALRPGGPGWFGGGMGTRPSRERWVPVERYMGTFERIHALVEAGLLDIELVEELYGYRVSNLVRDDNVYRNKLVANANGWRRFIQLWSDLDEASKRRKKQSLARRSPTQRDEDESNL
jgi:hypothetical protein